MREIFRRERVFSWTAHLRCRPDFSVLSLTFWSRSFSLCSCWTSCSFSCKEYSCGKRLFCEPWSFLYRLVGPIRDPDSQSRLWGWGTYGENPLSSDRFVACKSMVIRHERCVLRCTARQWSVKIVPQTSNIYMLKYLTQICHLWILDANVESST